MTCQTGKSIVSWVSTFVVATAIGFVAIGIGACGNAITCKRIYLPMLGIAAIVSYTVLLPWVNSLQRGTTYLQTASFSLLLEEVETERLNELEKEKSALEIVVIGLKGENQDLQVEIRRLTSQLQQQVDSNSDDKCDATTLTSNSFEQQVDSKSDDKCG
jgi:hypothetical protein